MDMPSVSKAMSSSCPVYYVFPFQSTSLDVIAIDSYWLRAWSLWTVDSYNVGEFSPLELPFRIELAQGLFSLHGIRNQTHQ